MKKLSFLFMLFVNSFTLAQVTVTTDAKNFDHLNVGEKTKDFTLNDIHGKPISLSSFKGKYVLLDFWASWCEPCRRENPNLVKLYKQYKAKGFEILGVSLDESTGKKQWIDAIKTDQISWTQVSDLNFWDNKAAKLYNIKALPYNFLINPEGVIIGRLLKGDRLAKKLQEIYGQ